MQFQVPQFIEVEDKIFGPLTLKQFIYIAGGVAITIILYILIPIKFIAIIIAIPFLVLSFALAFYKVNGKNFVDILEAAIIYSIKSKLYIWRKEMKKIDPKKEREVPIDPLLSPRLSDSKLKRLAWSLDVNEQIDNKKFRNMNAGPSLKEEKEDVEFKKNYDLQAQSHITYGS